MSKIFSLDSSDPDRFFFCRKLSNFVFLIIIRHYIAEFNLQMQQNSD